MSQEPCVKIQQNAERLMEEVAREVKTLQMAQCLRSRIMRISNKKVCYEVLNHSSKSMFQTFVTSIN